jgi:hypothetical protein
MAYGTTTVTTAATLILAENTKRKKLTIVNSSLSTILYVGPDSSITTSNSIPLYQNQSSVSEKIPEGYKGDIYGIVASGTADVRYWEEV